MSAYLNKSTSSFSSSERVYISCCLNYMFLLSLSLVSETSSKSLTAEINIACSRQLLVGDCIHVSNSSPLLHWDTFISHIHQLKRYSLGFWSDLSSHYIREYFSQYCPLPLTKCPSSLLQGFYPRLTPHNMGISSISFNIMLILDLWFSWLLHKQCDPTTFKVCTTPIIPTSITQFPLCTWKNCNLNHNTSLCKVQLPPPPPPPTTILFWTMIGKVQAIPHHTLY